MSLMQWTQCLEEPELARELGCVVPSLLRIISSKQFTSYFYHT